MLNPKKELRLVTPKVPQSVAEILREGVGTNYRKQPVSPIYSDPPAVVTPPTATASPRAATLAQEKADLARQKAAMPSVGGLQILNTAYQAGQGVQPTTSAGGAVAQTVGAGIKGAAEGAMVGAIVPVIGPAVGGAVGGLVGLVTGGINAFLGLRAARDARRQADRERNYIKKLNEQSRQDTWNQIEYNRKQSQMQNRWDTMMKIKNLINNRIAVDENLKNAFVQRYR